MKQRKTFAKFDPEKEKYGKNYFKFFFAYLSAQKAVKGKNRELHNFFSVFLAPPQKRSAKYNGTRNRGQLSIERLFFVHPPSKSLVQLMRPFRSCRTMNRNLELLSIVSLVFVHAWFGCPEAEGEAVGAASSLAATVALALLADLLVSCAAAKPEPEVRKQTCVQTSLCLWRHQGN